VRPASVEQTPRRTSLLSEIEHPTAGKVLWMGIGAVLAIALTVVGTAVAKPALSGDDRAYCAAHADVVADVWKSQRSDLSFDPRNEAANVAGYFRGDRDATFMVAAATYRDPGSWGERPDTGRADDQLGSACRALVDVTHR